MKKILVALVLCLSAMVMTAGEAEAITCAECETLVPDYDDWQILDWNGNGFSTADLIVIRKFQLSTGLDSFTMSDLVYYAVNQIDVTYDDEWVTEEDYPVLQKLAFFINATGQSSIDIQDLLDCGQMVILGTCVY